MNEIKAKITVLERNFRRLHQCLTCVHNPETCGCTEADEDANGMCMKSTKKRKEPNTHER